VIAIRGEDFIETDDADIELVSPTQFFGTHPNLIPMVSAVQSQRPFYGARFFNQAMPIKNPEAPLVQAIDDDGISFDKKMGKISGALWADDDLEIKDITPEEITAITSSGEKKKIPLYRSFPFNRKSAITHRPLVKPGDKVAKGSLIAGSNFTDNEGNLAMGLNARIGLVPYKGYSMDDAIVFSKSFAEKLSSEHTYTEQKDFDHDIKGGVNHYISLFPNKYTKEQLTAMDETGVVKPGTVLKQGDPIILATRPKTISSATASLGQLSKVMRQARSDDSKVWDYDSPGFVEDVAKTKKGYKVIIRTLRPTQVGDKVVLRSGNKGIVSKIVDDERMPRTVDGKPLDVLLNPLGIPSRVNSSLIYELLLGKVAAKTGKPIMVKHFTEPGQKWQDIVKKAMDEAGVTDKEEVFDPEEQIKLDNPITVGHGYIMKLHHDVASKISSRGQSGYDLNQQPSKGGPRGAKRVSGLETNSLLSSGAYATLREAATIRGQRNDEYWRAIRNNQTPKDPGRPFVWDKYLALVAGAGLNAKDLGNGRLRLGPMTDKELERRKAVEIQNGELIDVNTLSPIKGGLFDTSIVGNNQWGKISLPFKVPNPAFEGSIRNLLGLTQKEFRAIMAGEMELPEHLR
jgi:DNA-directed RNA polymerase subunit beta